MMRRWFMIIFAMIALVTVFAGASMWYAHSKATRLAQLEPQLDSTDPFERIDVGRRMLDLDTNNTTARMAMADAYITLSQHKQVREVLAPVIAGDAKTRPRALAILMDSHLTEAGDAITLAEPRSLDLTVQRVEALLAETETLLTDLSQTMGVKVMAAMIQARMLEIRAALLDLRITHREIAFRRDEASTPEPEAGLWIDPPEANEDAELVQWRQELADMHDRLDEFTIRAARMDPNMPTPYAVLFRMALRRNDIDLARKAAGKLSKLPRLGRRLAGRTADTLLRLERDYGIETKRVDLALAQRLLTHDNLRGIATMSYTLARATLALRIGQPDLAAQTVAPVLERYPGHPRATVLLAESLISRGRADEAASMLVALNDRVPTVEGRYVEAMAHHAAGRTSRGNDVLRQGLELDGHDLPSLLALAGSLAREGHINEAIADLNTAARIAPTHSRVIALQTQLLVEQAAHEDLPAHYLKTFESHPIDWRDAVMAAAMVMDDRQVVAAAATDRLAEDPADVRALVARYWTAAEATARADVAAVTVAAMLEQIDHDPLLWPRAPALYAVGGRAAVMADTLQARLLPSPHELALELLDVALDLWPDRDQLVRMRDDLRAALGVADAAGFRDADSPLRRHWAALTDAIGRRDNESVNAALGALLAEHPWDVSALMLAMNYDLQRGAALQAEAKVDIAGRINAKLGLLARGRLSLVTGKHSGALHDASMLGREEPVGSIIGYYAGDITARAHLAAGSSELAVNVLENLAIASPMGETRIKLAAIDALTQVERDNAAIAAVIAMTGEGGLSPRWIDRLLARAAHIVPAQRLVGMIDAMLNRHGDDPLLLVYKAQALIDVGDLTSANQALALAMLKRPESPRVLMLKASLHQALGQSGQAASIYRQLLDGPKRAAMAARLHLLRSGAAASVDPYHVEAP